jgi:hypothetical protein
MTLTEFYQQIPRRLRHQFRRQFGRVVGLAVSSSEAATGSPVRAFRGYESIALRHADFDPNRCVATKAKRRTQRTNTVFIVAKTSEMAVPVARLSIDLISVQN